MEENKNENQPKNCVAILGDANKKASPGVWCVYNATEPKSCTPKNFMGTVAADTVDKFNIVEPQDTISLYTNALSEIKNLGNLEEKIEGIDEKLFKNGKDKKTLKRLKKFVDSEDFKELNNSENEIKKIENVVKKIDIKNFEDFENLKKVKDSDLNTDMEDSPNFLKDLKSVTLENLKKLKDDKNNFKISDKKYENKKLDVILLPDEKGNFPGDFDGKCEFYFKTKEGSYEKYGEIDVISTHSVNGAMKCGWVLDTIIRGVQTQVDVFNNMVDSIEKNKSKMLKLKKTDNAENNKLETSEPTETDNAGTNPKKDVSEYKLKNLRGNVDVCNSPEKVYKYLDAFDGNFAGFCNQFLNGVPSKEKQKVQIKSTIKEILDKYADLKGEWPEDYPTVEKSSTSDKAENEAKMVNEFNMWVNTTSGSMEEVSDYVKKQLEELGGSINVEKSKVAKVITNRYISCVKNYNEFAEGQRALVSGGNKKKLASILSVLEGYEYEKDENNENSYEGKLSRSLDKFNILIQSTQRNEKDKGPRKLNLDPTIINHFFNNTPVLCVGLPSNLKKPIDYIFNELKNPKDNSNSNKVWTCITDFSGRLVEEYKKILLGYMENTCRKVNDWFVKPNFPETLEKIFLETFNEMDSAIACFNNLLKQAQALLSLYEPNRSKENAQGAQETKVLNNGGVDCVAILTIHDSTRRYWNVYNATKLEDVSNDKYIGYLSDVPDKPEKFDGTNGPDGIINEQVALLSDVNGFGALKAVRGSGEYYLTNYDKNTINEMEWPKNCALYMYVDSPKENSLKQVTIGEEESKKTKIVSIKGVYPKIQTEKSPEEKEKKTREEIEKRKGVFNELVERYNAFVKRHNYLVYVTSVPEFGNKGLENIIAINKKVFKKKGSYCTDLWDNQVREHTPLGWSNTNSLGCVSAVAFSARAVVNYLPESKKKEYLDNISVIVSGRDGGELLSETDRVDQLIRIIKKGVRHFENVQVKLEDAVSKISEDKKIGIFEHKENDSPENKEGNLLKHKKKGNAIKVALNKFAKKVGLKKSSKKVKDKPDESQEVEEPEETAAAGDGTPKKKKHGLFGTIKRGAKSVGRVLGIKSKAKAKTPPENTQPLVEDRSEEGEAVPVPTIKTVDNGEKLQKYFKKAGKYLKEVSKDKPFSINEFLMIFNGVDSMIEYKAWYEKLERIFRKKNINDISVNEEPRRGAMGVLFISLPDLNCRQDVIHACNGLQEAGFKGNPKDDFMSAVTEVQKDIKNKCRVLKASGQKLYSAIIRLDELKELIKSDQIKSAMLSPAPPHKPKKSASTTKPPERKPAIGRVAPAPSAKLPGEAATKAKSHTGRPVPLSRPMPNYPPPPIPTQGGENVSTSTPPRRRPPAPPPRGSNGGAATLPGTRPPVHLPPQRPNRNTSTPPRRQPPAPPSQETKPRPPMPKSSPPPLSSKEDNSRSFVKEQIDKLNSNSK